MEWYELYLHEGCGENSVAGGEGAKVIKLSHPQFLYFSHRIIERSVTAGALQWKVSDNSRHVHSAFINGLDLKGMSPFQYGNHRSSDFFRRSLLKQ